MLDELLATPLVLVGVEWKEQKLGDGGANLKLRARSATVNCRFVLDYRLQGGEDGALEHVTDVEHPLLARYVDLHAELFFNGAAERLDELLGALWRAHRDACGEWIGAHAYLRPQVLSDGHGLLASGPRLLLDRYAGVLARHGIEPSVIGDRPVQEWRGGKWQPRLRPPEALVFGRSFVVADAFSAERR